MKKSEKEEERWVRINIVGCYVYKVLTMKECRGSDKCAVAFINDFSATKVAR